MIIMGSCRVLILFWNKPSARPTLRNVVSHFGKSRQNHCHPQNSFIVIESLDPSQKPHLINVVLSQTVADDVFEYHISVKI